MTSWALAAAEESAETVRELPVSAATFGIGTLVVLLILLGITWSFRNVGTHH